MTQEDKQLLLKDLCARLPYRVHLRTNSTDDMELLDIVRDTDYEDQLWINGYYDIEEIKPYLRPASSMTEEEKQALEICNVFVEPRSIELKVDFYNQYHLDYRGLIKKGLALEAPDGMYKEEQQ